MWKMTSLEVHDNATHIYMVLVLYNWNCEGNESGHSGMFSVYAYHLKQFILYFVFFK
jgi:hypothetical protein